jgi:hypothetical protein
MLSQIGYKRHKPQSEARSYEQSHFSFVGAGLVLMAAMNVASVILMLRAQ